MNSGVIAAVGLAAFSSATLGQCNPEWSDRFGVGQLSGTIYAHAVFDEDGPGGRPPSIFAAGNFVDGGGSGASHLARWDGSKWTIVGTGVDNEVRALVVWDSDGSGPAPAALYAAGNFQVAGGVNTGGIARWTGTQWEALTPGIPAPRNVLSMTAYDEDGAGPNPTRLIAAGSFANGGGIFASRIIRFDGSAWSTVGLGIGGTGTVTVDAMKVYDQDGVGPTPPTLVCTGQFSTAGGLAAFNIAAWNGTSWSPMGSGLGPSTSKGQVLAVFDEDNDGPMPARLFVGGTFTTADGQPAAKLAAWNGSSWSGLGVTFQDWTWANGTQGGTVTSQVRALTVHDADGPLEPERPKLFVGGTFQIVTGPNASFEYSSLVAYDGTSWRCQGPAPAYGLLNPTAPSIFCLTSLDHDGITSTPNQLWGSDNSAFPLAIRGTRVRVGEDWPALGGELNERVRAVATFDDGSGAALYVGGDFDQAGNDEVQHLARWTEDGWTQVDGGLPANVYTMQRFDPDQGGPAPEALIIGGDFARPVSGGMSAERIVGLVGSQYFALEGGFNNSVRALAVFDEDGPGGSAPRLFAGGVFTTAGSAQTLVNGIARWDGASWSALGDGVNGVVNCMTVFDPDGPGPAQPRLIIAGSFTTAGGQPASRIAEWDGATWRPLGAGVNSTVNSLAVFDEDGAGPNPARLIVSGGFNTAGGQSAAKIARWDGAAWSPLGTGLSGGSLGAAGMTVWDDDGDGPNPAALYLTGDFTAAGGQVASRIATWNGLSWVPVITGLNNTGLAIAALDEDHHGPERPGLVVGGFFTRAVATASGRVARFGPGPGVEIVDQPESVTVSPGGTAQFRVIAHGGTPITYQWMKDGLTVVDGGRISGAVTATLTINPVESSDAGVYWVIATAQCGSAMSTSATLTAGCPADFDGDGVVDFNDYLAFLNLFNDADPRADLDGDGGVDFNDYLAFLNMFNQGC